MSDERSHLSSGAASSLQLLLIRTEHALEPHKAADVAVKVDVQMLVCVSHRYNVVQLVVEVKSFLKKDKKRLEESILHNM